MKARLDAGGVATADLDPVNIMIGTTRSEPVPRAGLVDSGGVTWGKAD